VLKITDRVPVWMIKCIGIFLILNFSACATDNKDTQSISKYEEKVVIPKYNPNDVTHVLITPSNGKWNRYVLNDPNKKHFYVKPGKYHTRVNLTRSGTKSSRRTLSLYNGNNTHPAALPVNQVADIRLNIMGASYWILDRLSNINDETRPSFYIHGGATYNIINRLHVKNFYYGIIITNLSHNNTIQNSYFDHMTHNGRRNDSVGIAIYSDKYTGGKVFNTHIINNDIRNSGDGIQLVIKSPKNLSDLQGRVTDYQGTVIDSNRIWFDGDAYTNGDYSTHGYNQNGQYMIGENALDLKAGSENPLNPVIISNNIMWGYLERDKTVGGSFSADTGKILSAQYGAKNIKIDSNIFFNSQVVFAVGSCMNWEVKNNIIADINEINPLDHATYAAYFYKSKSIKVENNTFRNILQNPVSGGYFFRFDSKTSNSTFMNNVAINSIGTSPSYGNRMEGNYLYKSKVNYNSTRDSYIKEVDINKMSDYTFTYERFTSNPEYKTLKGVVISNKSSYYDKAGATMSIEIKEASLYNAINIVNKTISVGLLIL